MSMSMSCEGTHPVEQRAIDKCTFLGCRAKHVLRLNGRSTLPPVTGDDNGDDVPITSMTIAYDLGRGKIGSDKIYKAMDADSTIVSVTVNTFDGNKTSIRFESTDSVEKRANILTARSPHITLFVRYRGDPTMCAEKRMQAPQQQSRRSRSRSRSPAAEDSCAGKQQKRSDDVGKMHYVPGSTILRDRITGRVEAV